jgi:GDPmannose 4,6-dehydratase
MSNAMIHFTRFSRWQGSGKEEVGIDEKTGYIVVRIDPKYYRPTEVDLLLGDATKAYKELGWQPKISFNVNQSIVCLVFQSNMCVQL